MKGLGEQEGGAQTSTNTSMQSSSPTQDVSPEAVAKAAGDLLATVAPGSEAAKLAQAAIDAARSGDAAKAKDLLTQSKAAAGSATASKTPDTNSPPSK